jgi:hypothetical protein
MIALLIRPDAPLASARVQGHIMPIRHVGSRSPWYPDHQMVTFLSAPAKGLVLQLSFAGPVPETIAVVDVAYGLPPEAQSLLQTRRPTGTASQSGDLSILVSPAKL